MASKIKQVDEWEVQNAVDTLKRAEGIKADGTMMAAVGIEISKQRQALDRINIKGTKPIKAKGRGKGKGSKGFTESRLK